MRSVKTQAVIDILKVALFAAGIGASVAVATNIFGIANVLTFGHRICPNGSMLLSAVPDALQSDRVRAQVNRNG
jgi:hypothetical protein